MRYLAIALAMITLLIQDQSKAALHNLSNRYAVPTNTRRRRLANMRGRVFVTIDGYFVAKGAAA